MPQVDIDRLITQDLGELLQAISKNKVVCLHELLIHVQKITASISCNFIVGQRAFKTTQLKFPIHLNSVHWHGVKEQRLPDLQTYGYPEAPIQECLKQINEINKGLEEGEYTHIFDLLRTGLPFFGPAKLGSEDQEITVLLVGEPFSLPKEVSSSVCYIILINPLHVSARPDQDKRPERLDPVFVIARLWPWWFYYARSRLRKYCRELSTQEEHDERNALEIFQSLIRLHTLADIIAFSSAGLLRRRGDNEQSRKKQEDWLVEEIINIVNGKTGSGWHNCMEEPWPPCHEGKLADRELADTLLWFCPWTSGAQTKCQEVPGRLRGSWHKLIIDRLWGWMPVKLDDKGEPTCGYRELVGVDTHCLDEKSLSRLFAAEFLCGNVHAPYFETGFKHIGFEERGQCVAHVGRVLHYLLAKTPLDWRTIEGLVWMIAEYGHSHLGIDPRLDIASHLLHAARTEPALHAMQAYYRDHFFHAIEVCFLGHLLLITQDGSGKYLWEYVAEQFSAMRRAGKWRTDENKNGEGTSSLEDVLRQWYVAALIHDVGYAIQIFCAVQGMLEFYHHPPEMEQFRKGLQAAFTVLSDDIRASSLAPLLGLTSEDEPGGDHGVIAAAHLQELLRKLGKDEYPGSYYPAIRAIGMHNNRRAKVSFETDPLAFLLILCDTIQEWNRPHLRHATAPAMLLSRLMATEEEQERTTGPLETVSLNLQRFGRELGCRHSLKVEDTNTLKMSLFYTQEIQMDAGVFNLWIDSSCNLQRLSLDRFPLNIELEFWTPWFSRPGYKDESQMQRLRDAAAETHMHLLRDWLPRSIEGTNATRAVRHSYNESLSSDVLALDLRRLTERKTIRGDVSQFRDCLRNWKRWSEDRDYAGDYAPRIPGL